MLLRKRAASADATSGSGTQGGRNVQYCLSPLLFEGSGGILLKTPSGLSVQAVLRLPSHCSLRAHLTVSEWLNAASAVGGITADVATQIFDTFSILSCKGPEVRLQQSKVTLSKIGPEPGNCQGAAAKDTKATSLNSRTVSLPGLMLYLISQIAMERPPRTDSRENLASSEQISSFIKQHLHEIVSAVAVTKTGRVSLSDLSELRVLLREFNAGTESPIGSNLSFLWPRGEQTVDCAVISQFIRQRLVAGSDIRAAASTNVIHRGLNPGVHIIQSGPAPRPSSMFALSNIASCSIYVLAPLPSVLLSGLANCLVVLGPCAGVLTVTQCENCQIVAMSSGLSVSQCRDTDFFVCVNSPPILTSSTSVSGDGAANLSGNERISIGPYNTFYSTLEEHLTATGVNPKLNFFRATCVPPSMVMDPVSGTDGNGFNSIAVPASPQSSNTVTTRANPVPLPPEYMEQLSTRTQKFAATSQMLQDAYKQLEDHGRRDLAEGLRTKVHKEFMDWLVTSGQARGVLDLLNNNTTSASSAGSSVQ